MSSEYNHSMMLTKPRSFNNQKTAVGKVPIPGKDQEKTLKFLDPARQKKLREIKDREELQGKVEQVKAVLGKKMILKYGRINSDTIFSLIDEFVKNTDKISSDALSQLESKIQQRISVSSSQTNNKNVAADNLNQTSKVDVSSKDDNKDDLYTSVNASNNNNNNKPKTAPANIKGEEWHVIAAYDKVVGDEIEERRKQKELQSRLQFKKSLDDHVLLAKQLHLANDSKDELLYSQYVSQDVLNYRLEQENKNKKMKDKSVEITKARLEQIAEQKRLKDEEKNKEKEFEIGIVKIALQKLEIEKNMTVEHRKRDDEIRKKIHQDNEENKKILLKQHGQDRLEDQRLNAEYIAKLDKEAYDRNHAFEKRMATLDKKQDIFVNATKAAIEEEKRREALQLKELNKTIEKEHQEFLKKESEKKLRIQKMLADNNVITECRDSIKKQELIEKMKISEQYKKEENELKQLIENERLRRLQEQKRYNDLLTKQLQERESNRLRMEEMVEQERKINKDKLDKAIAREEIINQVFSAHKPTASSTVRALGPF